MGWVFSPGKKGEQQNIYPNQKVRAMLKSVYKENGTVTDVKCFRSNS